MASRITTVYAAILFVLISSVPMVMAGNYDGRWNNPRDYEPVIIKGENFIDFLQQPTKELYLYAYNAIENSWRPIPFQIDQKDDSSHFWVPVPNDSLDGDDELVFMAKDMGDKAPDGSYWIDDLDSRAHIRVEITAMDPVEGKEAWVYLYRSENSLPLAPEQYVSYKPDARGKGADTITALTYIESHDSTGIPIEWKLPQGSGVDILDRQKVLLKMKLFGWVDFPVMEDVLGAFFKKIEKKAGPIRVVREVFWYINIGMGIPPFEFSLPLQYYPYSIESGGVSGSLKASDHVYFIRQSFDLNPNAAGMKFYNFYNQTGKLIDGVGGNDGVINTLDDAPAVNWWLITGNQGSYAIVFRMSEIGKTRTLYYNDDKTVLKEGEDTGDMMSWGNTGIQIEGTDMAGNISFAYKAYYLGANKPYSLGDSLATNFKKPLEISTRPNYYVPVELAFFRAIDSNGKVILEWVTATESNNYGFEIQRKAQTEIDWATIGTVKGSGTSTTPHAYSFVDNVVSIGAYYYRLKQIDFDGSFEYSHDIFIAVTPPRVFSLAQNYPNPFNPETIIRYQIPNSNRASLPVELKIYNLMGDEVRTIVQQEQGAGFYSVRWDGKNNQGEIVAAGTYIYRLQAGDFIKSHKMLLLR